MQPISPRLSPNRRRIFNPRIIRAWAKGRGYKVGERGRIPHDVLVAFYHSQARRWAKRQGLEVGERGRVPQNIFEAFSKGLDV